MISSNTNSIQYTGNNATTSFAFAFYFFATTDLVVYTTDPTTGAETPKTPGTDYNVTVAGQSPYTAGGTVVFNVAPAAGIIITIIRFVSPTQISQYLANSNLDSAALEQSLDRLTMLIQLCLDNFSRCIQIMPGDTRNLNLQVPASIVRAGKTLTFDGSGNVTAT